MTRTKFYFEAYIIQDGEKVFKGLYKKDEAKSVVNWLQGRYFNPQIHFEEANI